MKKEIEVNFRIRDREVRVIDGDGQQLGVMSSRDAQDLAKQRGLDLVKISPSAKPPVCKIVDYGKYKFDIQKKEKEAKKNQKQVEVKEIWLSMTIEKHDLQTKAAHARKFLLSGDKVKVSIRMRGRQQAYTATGIKVMHEFYGGLEDISNIERDALAEGRNIIMILYPKTQKQIKEYLEEKINAENEKS